jgi:hypothetical protein
MDEHLENQFKAMPDNTLLDLYSRRREEYTEEALNIMKAEISSRKLELPSADSGNAKTSKSYSRDDFVPLEIVFSQVDILLIQIMMREHGIPFFAQATQAQSSVLPVDGQIMQNYALNVPAEKKDEAAAIINEHFDARDGVYVRKRAGGKDRLRSMSFNEIQISELEAEEEVSVELGEDERDLTIKYLDRAISDADEIEKKLERVIFYYDNLEELRNHLASDNSNLTRGDLLAILEVMQIFCDEPDFPKSLENAADAILDFISFEG